MPYCIDPAVKYATPTTTAIHNNFLKLICALGSVYANGLFITYAYRLSLCRLSGAWMNGSGLMKHPINRYAGLIGATSRRALSLWR